jgi:AraC-like DNA-binding protein
MGSRSGPFMERQPIFHSRDVEQTRAFLDSVNFRFEVMPADAKELDVRLNGVYLPNSYIGYLQYGSPVDIRATPARNDYWVQLPIRGQIEISVGSEQTICNTTCAAILSPARDNRIRNGGESARFGVTINRDALVRQLEGMLDEPVNAGLDFDVPIDLTQGYGLSLARQVAGAVADIEQSGGLCWSPITISLFEQFVISTLLRSHPHNFSKRLQRPAGSIAPGDLKRAIDFMEAHLGSPITIADIAQASGVAGRTLFKHFQDFRRMSPMRYLRLARLREVRQALQRAQGNQGVTEIAMNYGFSHMGRFAVEYRKHFGESPSDTLARRLKSS